MGYEVIREERIPLVEGRRIGDKRYLFRNITVRITDKELIFTDRGRTYRYTLRLSGVYRLKLQKVKKDGETRHRIQVNDFKFYGTPELFDLLEEKMKEGGRPLPKAEIPSNRSVNPL